jgi:hypothetical protein
VEVCLVGLFGREYRKLASAIPAGLGLWRRQKGSRREAPGRESEEWALIESPLCRLGWHLFPLHLSRLFYVE